jgi:SNF2 family DNA or RNA helicase
MSLVSFTASQLVSSVMKTAITQYMANYENRFAKFGMLLNKAGFGFNKHQFEGVSWCVNHELHGAKVSTEVRGGIIADEMGLGKTTLMIGTMFTNFVNKTLIVVPPILILQWYNEIYKCSGHKALIYHGKNKASIGLTELAAAKACIIITSYNTLLPIRKNGKDKKEKENHLFSIKWNRLIFDEAHHLRNSRTTRFQACKKIKAPIKWMVSGTPIQNRRSDLYSLCNMLGFEKSFYKNADGMSQIVDKHVLRRTKADVGIQLPPVVFENIVVPWKNANEKLLSEEIHSLIPNQSGVSCKKGDLVANHIISAQMNHNVIMLLAMLRSRQSCVLPALMKDPIGSCVLADESGKYLDALEYTSKLDAVVKLILLRRGNGKGKIVFCHFIGEIDMIASRLLKEGISRVVTYDGRNSGNTAKLCDAADVIILQIQTGCEGLNLQKYFSEIYFVSPHWNPAVEDQAIARCHRIGQELEVNVFRFEMEGFDKMDDQVLNPITLEKYVNRVQGSKRDIAISTFSTFSTFS